MTEIQDKIVAGERPEIPEICPTQFADIMKLCWHQDPAVRPIFERILSQLKEIPDNDLNLEKSFREQDLILKFKRGEEEINEKKRISLLPEIMRSSEPVISDDTRVLSEVNSNISLSAATPRKDRHYSLKLTKVDWNITNAGLLTSPGNKSPKHSASSPTLCSPGNDDPLPKNGYTTKSGSEINMSKLSRSQKIVSMKRSQNFDSKKFKFKINIFNF